MVDKRRKYTWDNEDEGRGEEATYSRDQIPEDPGTGKVKWQTFKTLAKMWRTLTGIEAARKSYEKRKATEDAVGHGHVHAHEEHAEASGYFPTFRKLMGTVLGGGEKHGGGHHHRKIEGINVDSMPVRQAIKLTKENARGGSEKTPRPAAPSPNPKGKKKQADKRSSKTKDPSDAEKKSFAHVPLLEAGQQIENAFNVRGVTLSQRNRLLAQGVVPPPEENYFLIDRALFERIANEVLGPASTHHPPLSSATISLVAAAQLFGVALEEITNAMYTVEDTFEVREHCFFSGERLHLILKAIANLTDEQIAAASVPEEDPLSSAPDAEIREPLPLDPEERIQAIRALRKNDFTAEETAWCIGVTLEELNRMRELGDITTNLSLDPDDNQQTYDACDIFECIRRRAIIPSEPEIRIRALEKIEETRSFISLELAARYLLMRVSELRQMGADGEIEVAFGDCSISDVIDLIRKRELLLKKDEDELLTPDDEMFGDDDDSSATSSNADGESDSKFTFDSDRVLDDEPLREESSLDLPEDETIELEEPPRGGDSSASGFGAFDYHPTQVRGNEEIVFPDDEKVDDKEIVLEPQDYYSSDSPLPANFPEDLRARIEKLKQLDQKLVSPWDAASMLGITQAQMRAFEETKETHFEHSLDEEDGYPKADIIWLLRKKGEGRLVVREPKAPTPIQPTHSEAPPGGSSDLPGDVGSNREVADDEPITLDEPPRDSEAPFPPHPIMSQQKQRASARHYKRRLEDS